MPGQRTRSSVGYVLIFLVLFELFDFNEMNSLSMYEIEYMIHCLLVSCFKMFGIGKKLNQEQGITIMVSSHLLLEIEKLVTDVGIIHKGKMLFEGNLADLKQRQNELAQVVFEVNNIDAAWPILKQLNMEAAFENNKIILQAPSRNTIAEINKHFVHEGIDVYSISTIRQDLEAIFMEITQS